MNCSIEGCAKPKRSKNQPLCDMHYCRVRRTGDVGTAQPRPLLHGATCTIEGCDRKQSHVSGLCSTHRTRYLRHGDPSIVLTAPTVLQDAHPSWKGEGVSYRGVHERLRATQGVASTHPCVDCGGQAQHWSYDHGDDNERASIYGPYSTDLTRYQARCVSCHKQFDLALAH